MYKTYKMYKKNKSRVRTSLQWLKYQLKSHSSKIIITHCHSRQNKIEIHQNPIEINSPQQPLIEINPLKLYPI